MRHLHRSVSKSPRAIAFLGLLLAVSACRTVEPAAVQSWREAVIASKEQSSATFTAVGLLVRESQLDRIERSDPGVLQELKETDFAPGLPADGLRRWNAAFDALDSYASSIEILLSPDLPQGVGDSLREVGERIGTSAKADLLKSDRELSGAIGELGRRIVAAMAGSRAREIMLEVDPAIRQVTTQMADMLLAARAGMDEEGNPIVKESGVLVTVRATWDDEIDRFREPFRREKDGRKRREMAEQFAGLLDQRATAEGTILGLRRGILDLAAAHTAAAQGRAIDLGALIQSTREDVKAVRELVESLKSK